MDARERWDRRQPPEPVAPEPETHPVYVSSANTLAKVRLDRATATAKLNAYRAEKGLNPLRLDPAATAMAERQAQAMAQSGTMSHDVAGSLSARLAASGINAPAGENLGEGYMSFEQALAGWRASGAPDLATSTLGLSWPMVGGIGLFVVNLIILCQGVA
jgi:uncharacterized protein YkwD